MPTKRLRDTHLRKKMNGVAALKRALYDAPEAELSREPPHNKPQKGVVQRNPSTNRFQRRI